MNFIQFFFNKFFQRNNYSKKINFLMNNITIYICVPGICIKQVRACPDMHVRSLNKLFANNQKSFYFDGFKLNEDKTLQKVGIRENDTIIALPKNAALNPKIFSIKPNTDVFDEKIQITFNSNIKGEAIRLRDLQLMKLEVKSKMFNKFVKNFHEKDEAQFVQEPIKTPTFYSRPEKPASEPLPCFWGTQTSYTPEPEDYQANPTPLVVPLDETAAKNL